MTLASKRVRMRKRLSIGLESADLAGDFVQRVLAVVAERRVSEVMRQSGGASTTFGSQPSAAPISRAICATSSECVSRVRGKSSSPGTTT